MLSLITSVKLYLPKIYLLYIILFPNILQRDPLRPCIYPGPHPAFAQQFQLLITTITDNEWIFSNSFFTLAFLSQHSAVRKNFPLAFICLVISVQITTLFSGISSFTIICLVLKYDTIIFGNLCQCMYICMYVHTLVVTFVFVYAY